MSRVAHDGVLVVGAGLAGLTAALGTCPPGMAPMLPWMTYLPMAGDDAAEIDPLRRIRHRREAEPIPYWKVVMGPPALDDDGIHHADAQRVHRVLRVVAVGCRQLARARRVAFAGQPAPLGVTCALWAVLMLLVLPTSWMHYETQLLLPLAVVLPYALAARRLLERLHEQNVRYAEITLSARSMRRSAAVSSAVFLAALDAVAST